MEYRLYRHSSLVGYCAVYPTLDMSEIALSFSNPENGLSILVVNV